MHTYPALGSGGENPGGVKRRSMGWCGGSEGSRSVGKRMARGQDWTRRRVRAPPDGPRHGRRPGRSRTRPRNMLHVRAFEGAGQKYDDGYNGPLNSNRLYSNFEVLWQLVYVMITSTCCFEVLQRLMLSQGHQRDYNCMKATGFR
jgi:hypothetical protein